jgi:hypothetical protein
MNRFNPISVNYKDLVKYQEDQIRWMEKALPAMKLTGKISANAADHKLECARTILRLLKKYDRNPQLNLQDEFAKMNGR